MLDYSSVLIVGAGEGFSASLARAFAREGVRVTLAARRPERLEALCRETGATAHRCDASDPAEVAALFAALDEDGAPEAVVYNPSLRARGSLVELDPEEVRRSLGSVRPGLRMAPSMTRWTTRMPWGCSSRAMLWARPRSANLPMAKGAERG